MDRQPHAFERLAVYFDVGSYAATLSGLTKTNFNFDRDNFQKLAGPFAVSQESSRLLTELIAGVGALGFVLLGLGPAR